MAKRAKAKKASKKTPADLVTQLSKLGEDGRTGTLHVDRPQGASVDVHLMMGAIIAAGSDDDDRNLGRILVSSGAINAEAFEMITMDIKPDEDLADILMQADSVDGAAMMQAGSAVFRDNLAWAIGSPGAIGAFEELDMVFPSNMQLGLDRDELLLEISEWRDEATPVLDTLTDKQTIGATGDQPEDCADVLWTELQQPRPIAALVDVVGPPFILGTVKLARWLQAGLLGAMEEDQYAKAARGGFVKSYEVLDKVDLQGVAILGADAPTVPSAPSLEAIEAFEMDEDDFEEIEVGGDSQDVELPFDEDHEPTEGAGQPLRATRPEQPVLVDGRAPTGELGSGDFDLFEDDEDDGADAIIDADETGSIRIAADDSLFSREQLNDFEDRIKVFNNIFRVIFATFAEHITQEKSRQRFNALLGSGQRQYPELFRNLTVGRDGTVPASPLINNLAECAPGDHSALLHQGLYELIFSHLYDAKDMLRSEAEAEMMEKIVVFERQLHQM